MLKRKEENGNKKINKKDYKGKKRLEEEDKKKKDIEGKQIKINMHSKKKKMR
jgi:hypothetical protein